MKNFTMRRPAVLLAVLDAFITLFKQPEGYFSGQVGPNEMFYPAYLALAQGPGIFLALSITWWAILLWIPDTRANWLTFGIACAHWSGILTWLGHLNGYWIGVQLCFLLALFKLVRHSA